MKECHTSNNIECEYYYTYRDGEFTGGVACSDKQAKKAWAVYKERMKPVDKFGRELVYLVENHRFSCPFYAEVNHSEIREREKVIKEAELSETRGEWPLYYQDKKWWQ